MYLLSCMTYTPHSQEGATTLSKQSNTNTLKGQRLNNRINSCNKIHTHHMQQDTHKMNMQTYSFNLQMTPAACTASDDPALSFHGWIMLAMVLQHSKRLALFLQHSLVKCSRCSATQWKARAVSATQWMVLDVFVTQWKAAKKSSQ